MTWATMQFGLSPAERSDLIDDDTSRLAVAGIRAAYAEALELIAPRVLARIHHTLTAAGGTGDQIITDQEWQDITSKHVDDVLGDSILDGVIAGAVSFGKLASSQGLVKAFLSAIQSVAGFVSQLRSNVDSWIENVIGQGLEGDWGIGRVIDELNRDSPVSPDKADLVAGYSLQAANNAGLYAALEEVAPAALRWVTQRDERVRPSHAAADTETIPFGETFRIDGYEARYPGDPQLPFHLRVNCRCQLAYVDGTEARRVIGSTKAELRAKATQLAINGRSQMSKGELQHAVLKGLCLQGLAGGPDCPDTFDQQNRTALLTLARSEGIPGRHRMNREQLAYELRRTLRGGDTALVARGYARSAEFAQARDRATYKRGRAGDVGEFATGQVPPPAARREARGALFDEFGGKPGGSVPCVHCGLRLSPDPSQGLAVLVPEPIVPWSNGGSLALSNLVPSCPSCFRARGGRGLVSDGSLLDDITVHMSLHIDASHEELSLARVQFGVDQVPRDYHGRWTDGGAGSSAVDRVKVDNAAAALFAEVSTIDGEYHEEDARQFDEQLNGDTGMGHAAWVSYIMTGHTEVNDMLSGKHAGRSTITDDAGNTYSPVEELDKVMAEYGHMFNIPDTLVRGKGPKSRLLEMDWDVGHTFTDKGFGSWSANGKTALGFADAHEKNKAVILRLDSRTVDRAIPGEYAEFEFILPRNMKYRVTAIKEFVDPAGGITRLIDVAPDDSLTASAEFRGAAAVPRDYHGRWTDGSPGANPAKYGKTIPEKRGTGPTEWFASPAEFASARKLVARKARDVPEPTAEQRAKNRKALEKAKTQGRAGGELRGNSFTRRARAEALFAEFGGGKDGKTYCPCGHCGLKVSPGGRNGHALMQQDKILVATEGGTYGTPTNFPNLIPSCGGCNSSRNDAPLATRPKWQKKKSKSMALEDATFVGPDVEDPTLTPGSLDLALVDPADSLTATVGGEVIANPLGWDNPEMDTIGHRIQGILGHRTVTVDWGTYEQWIVGGEVVDPSTIERVADSKLAT